MKTKTAPVKTLTPTKSKPVATVTAIPPSKAPPMPKPRKSLPVEAPTPPVTPPVMPPPSFAPVSDIQLAQLKIEWVSRDTIKPNTYNPNKMTWQDRMLLRSSLLEDGWTQPIVTLPDHTIVDGEQRWTTSGIETTPEDIQEIIDRMEKRKTQGAIVSESVLGRLYESKRRLVEAVAAGLPPCIASITGGLVPITTINLTDEAHRMISTIRHNRARGSHKLDSMSTILTDLQKLGLDIDDLEKRLGMDDEDLYRNNDGVTRFAPIWLWTHEETFAYLAYAGVKLPPCYWWTDGFRVSTNPWPKRRSPNHAIAWARVYEVEPAIVHQAAEILPSAANWLKEYDM